MNYWDYGLDLNNAYNDGFDDGIKSATPKWIPCSERLPDLYIEVIVSHDSYVYTAKRTDVNPHTGMIEDVHWEDIETAIYVQPDAWMPLPEPYGGEDMRGKEDEIN